jgi:hypothetical protein
MTYTDNQRLILRRIEAISARWDATMERTGHATMNQDIFR